MNPRVLTATALIALGFVLFWPSGSSKKVERLYKDGEQLYSTENYEESIAKFEEALIESEKWGVKTAVIDKDFVPGDLPDPAATSANTNFQYGLYTNTETNTTNIIFNSNIIFF